MSDKTVKVTLVAVAQPYVQGMKQASDQTSKLGRDIDQTGDKAGKFGSKVNVAKTALAGMAAAGAAVAGTALVAFLSDAVSAAGDLEQSVGGVNAVFGESAEEIHAFGENSAEAVGLSRNQFNELVTVTGALLKNKGLEDFSQKSLDLVGIGADLAATFGGSTKDAVEALNAAMRGEADPIERYGISINQTAVNAEMAARGLDKLTGEAEAQAEAQVRIELITRQSADALGAFAREADTLQGQQQRLNAEWEDAKASLGQAFLPALTDAVSMIREGVDAGLAIVAAFQSIPDPVKAAATALAAVHLLGGPIGRGFSAASDGVKKFAAQASTGAGAMSALQGAGKGLLGFLGGPWGIAFTAAAGLMTVWIGEHVEAKREQAELKDSLNDVTGAITEQTEALAAQQLNDDGWLDKYRKWGGNVDDLTQAYLGNEDALARVRDVLGEANQAQITAGNVNTEHGTEAAELGTILDANVEKMTAHREATLLEAEASGAAADAMTEGADAALGLGSALGGVGENAVVTEEAVDHLGRTEEEAAEQTKLLREQHDALIDSLVEAVDAAFAAADAEMAYEASLDALTEAIEENGKKHDISTEAGRKNREALIRVAEAARDNARAQFENGDSLSSVQTKMRDAREAFIKGAEQMGYTRGEARRMADDFGLTADKVSTLRQEVGALPAGKNINITVTTRYVTIGDPANSGYSARTLRSIAEDGAIFSPRDSGGFGVDLYGTTVAREPMLGGPRHGKRYIVWGEDSTNEEAYISRKPGMEARNKGILDVAAGWFGGKVSWHADGALWTRSPLTSPPAAASGAAAIEVNVPVQTYERADPNLIGAAVAWQVGGLP